MIKSLGQKSSWTKVYFDNCHLNKTLLGQLVPWTKSPLGQLLQHPIVEQVDNIGHVSIVDYFEDVTLVDLAEMIKLVKVLC